MGIEGHIREAASGLQARTPTPERQQKLAEAAAKIAAEAKQARESLEDQHVRGSE